MFKKLISTSLCSIMLFPSLGTNFINANAMFSSQGQIYQKPKQQETAIDHGNLNDYFQVLCDDDCLLTILVDRDYPLFPEERFRKLAFDAQQSVIDILELQLDRPIPVFFTTDETPIISYPDVPVYESECDAIFIPHEFLENYSTCVEALAHELTHAIIINKLDSQNGVSLPYWLLESLSSQNDYPCNPPLPVPVELICPSDEYYFNNIMNDSEASSLFKIVNQYIVQQWIKSQTGTKGQIIVELIEFVNIGGDAGEFFQSSHGNEILQEIYKCNEAVASEQEYL